MTKLKLEKTNQLNKLQTQQATMNTFKLGTLCGQAWQHNFI